MNATTLTTGNMLQLQSRKPGATATEAAAAAAAVAAAVAVHELPNLGTA